MPYKLAVSFEIKWEDTDEGQKEYADIYRALNAAIKADLTDDDWWSENTAYYVLNTREAPEKFVVRVWREAGMRENKDRILVLDARDGSGVAYGEFNDKTVFSLLPSVVRLSPVKELRLT
jgi:hypothetical protein